MKTLLTVATLFLVGLSASPSSAQNTAGINASKHGIAVVDVSYIFKNHARFRAQMDGMKGKMASIEQQLESDRQNVIKLEEQKKDFKVGSQEFKNLDNQVAQGKAQLQLKMQRLRKDFMEEESKYYYETYQEVSKAIDYYCKRQGIAVVLRFNGEKADPNQPKQVLQEINKLVQFQNQIDITPDILALLNRNAGVATRPTRTN